MTIFISTITIIRILLYSHPLLVSFVVINTLTKGSLRAYTGSQFECMVHHSKGGSGSIRWLITQHPQMESGTQLLFTAQGTVLPAVKVGLHPSVNSI